MRGGENIWRAAAPMQCHAAKNRNGCPARIDSDRESWRPSHPPIAATFVKRRRTAAGQTKICKLYRLYRYAIYLHQVFSAIRRNRSNVKRKEVSQTISATETHPDRLFVQQAPRVLACLRRSQECRRRAPCPRSRRWISIAARSSVLSIPSLRSAISREPVTVSSQGASCSIELVITCAATLLATLAIIDLRRSINESVALSIFDVLTVRFAILLQSKRETFIANAGGPACADLLLLRPWGRAGRASRSPHVLEASCRDRGAAARLDFNWRRRHGGWPSARRNPCWLARGVDERRIGAPSSVPWSSGRRMPLTIERAFAATRRSAVAGSIAPPPCAAGAKVGQCETAR